MHAMIGAGGLNPIMNKSTGLLHSIQPLTDSRWDDFVARHPRSSVFHSSAWLSALHRTYGYQPVAYTTSLPEEELADAVVFCRIDSWLTGKRLVSLPFSDHCEPLVDDAGDLEAFYAVLDAKVRSDGLDYVELRPRCTIGGVTSLFRSIRSFCFHQIDLTPDLESLYANCHKDSTRRKIRRAEREGLTYEEGRSPALLDAFYRLLILTRRRHHIFPQPKAWFENLVACFGDDLKIRVASMHDKPIASILTLRHKKTLVYKYGGSDGHFHPFGPVQFLFWRTIQQAKRDGLRTFDLGRSDTDQPGLIRFKDRLGAVRSTLTYSRFSLSAPLVTISTTTSNWTGKVMWNGAVYLPDCMMPLVGSLIYRHVS